MAKWMTQSGIVQLGFAFGILGFFSACTPNNSTPPAPTSVPTVDTSAVSAPALVNCHFQTQKATYSFNTTIKPNPITCDNGGVPRTVQVLSPAPLPPGLEFDATKLALVGTATEKQALSPYKFYLENEAGYVIINLQITVQ